MQLTGYCTGVQLGVSMWRHTVAEAVRLSGRGVHSDVAVDVVLGPAPWGSGVCFVVDGREVPATVGHARAEVGCTAIEAAGRRVRTPEHVLAAVAGLGLSDLRVELTGGDEVPILDGSAAPWLAALRGVGLARGPVMAPRRVVGPVRVESHGGWASWEPGPGCVVHVEVDFGPGGPSGAVTVDLDAGGFDAVAAARTFIRQQDATAARAAGLGAGATSDNTVLWPTAALRYPDEPVRHKALDAIGDLALLGPWRGTVRVVRGSHRLHHALMQASRSRWVSMIDNEN